MKKCGIYKIYNIINSKNYIGSAIDINQRWKQHRKDLCRDKHHSILLQRAWNKYKQNNFIFEIIEECENKEILLIREQYYLDTLKPEYNICKIAGSQLGVKRTEETKQKISEYKKIHYEETNKQIEYLAFLRRGTHMSMEQKEKISNALKCEKNYNWKRTRGKDELEKMKISALKRFDGKKLEDHPNAKLNWNIVKEIRKEKMDNLSMFEFAQKYNVKKSTIWKVVNNYSWVEKIAKE